MAANILEIKNWSTEEIKELLQSNMYKEGMKLFAVYLVSKGWSARKLEELFDVSFKQITIWVHEFDEQGEAGLQEKPKTGRNSKLNNEDKNLLKNIILNKKPKDYNIDDVRWKGESVGILIQKKFNIEYKKAQIYNIINSLKIKFENGKWIEIN